MPDLLLHKPYVRVFSFNHLGMITLYLDGVLGVRIILTDSKFCSTSMGSRRR